MAPWLGIRPLAIILDSEDHVLALSYPVCATMKADPTPSAKVDLTDKPAPVISPFIDNDYFLGNSLHRTDTNEGLWPAKASP